MPQSSYLNINSSWQNIFTPILDYKHLCTHLLLVKLNVSLSTGHSFQSPEHCQWFSYAVKYSIYWKCKYNLIYYYNTWSEYRSAYPEKLLCVAIIVVFIIIIIIIGIIIITLIVVEYQILIFSVFMKKMILLRMGKRRRMV